MITAVADRVPDADRVVAAVEAAFRRSRELGR